MTNLLREHTAPYCREPLPIRDLAVFVQADRDRPFEVIARFPFQA
jgi:hypothetical protein